MELAFRNARIIARDTIVVGSVLTRDGIVSDVGPGGEVGEDLEGDWLAPGIVDMHTDNLEKHFFPRLNIDWDPRSASIVHDGMCASVGVTTVYNSLSIGSYANLARTQDHQARLIDGLACAHTSGLLRIDHKFHWRCELPAPDMAARLDRVVNHPMTGLLSLMDHTPGQRQYRNLERFQRSLSDEGMSDADLQERLTLARARQAANVAPNRAQVAAIAEAKKIPLAAHDDETVEHVDVAATAGATISEFPVTLQAAERAKARGMAVIMGGPNLIRRGSYSGNVAAAEIAEADILDGFASDYVLRSLIECAVMLTQAPFNWPWPTAWAVVSSGPATALGLSDRGVIAPGKRADLVRFNIVGGRPVVRGVWLKARRVA